MGSYNAFFHPLLFAGYMQETFETMCIGFLLHETHFTSLSIKSMSHHKKCRHDTVFNGDNTHIANGLMSDGRLFLVFSPYFNTMLGGLEGHLYQ